MVKFFQINIVVSLQDADVAAGNSTAQKLVGLVERKTLKQTVMTQVYGVTQYGAREQIKGRNCTDILLLVQRSVDILKIVSLLRTWQINS